MERRYITLHSPHVSVVLECGSHEAPLWRYWGPRLPEGCTPGPWLRDTRPVPPSSLEEERPLSVLPTFGVGWFGQSALLAHRQGRDFAQQFDACHVTEVDAQRSVVFELHDHVAQLVAKLEMQLGGDDVLRLRTTLVNEGAALLQLQWLAAGTLPLPGTCDRVRSFHGQWANEFRAETEPLTHSLWRRENRRGRTSHDCFPGALVMGPQASADTGLVYGAHLAWSGNHQQTIEPLAEGGFQWQLGEWLAPGEVELAPGESIATPELYAACSTHGFNGLAASFHAAVRAALPWPTAGMRPRPVHLNTWEAIYFDHDMQALESLAEAAAQVGVERFVLDDGWFHGRHSDRAALGDWWPDEHKYPQGLAPLARRVNALGMEFGLWVEPEMVSPDSELYRNHPGWALQLDSRPLLTGRNQLVLDVARQEVADHLFSRLDTLLREVPISYFKWDMNRDLTTAGSGGRAAYRAQVRSLYRLMQRLRDAHPQLEIESCSSGGARIDLGVLRHTHRVWTSDCNDARSRVGIQRGALQFFPPEVLGAHVGPAPAHTTGRSQSLDFRAAVALPLHLGVETDVRRLDAAARQRLAGWIALYKQLRGRLHGCAVQLGEAGDGIVWQAHGDDRQLVLLVYRLEPTAQRYSPSLRLPMLDAQRRYRVRRLDSHLLPELPGGGRSALHEAWSQPEGAVLHGSWLRNAGLALPRLAGESALVMDVTALD